MSMRQLTPLKSVAVMLPSLALGPGRLLQRRRGEQPAPSSVSHSPCSVLEAPPVVHEVLRSPGQPLDASTRSLMEPRFGRDFSGVRVHSDAAAQRSARDINAKAYAV